jgi:UDP-N-acetylglucosamine transferase subunit ALG13
MILVTVGTNEAPFDRLLSAVKQCRLQEELVVQHGPSSVRLADATCVEFLPYESLLRHAREARVVIAHAGAGSILLANHAGKKPIVMPRLRRYQEAVDDHQLAFARRMSEVSLVDLVEGGEQLARMLRTTSAPREVAVKGGSLALEIRSFLVSALGQPPARSSQRERTS